MRVELRREREGERARHFVVRDASKKTSELKRRRERRRGDEQDDLILVGDADVTRPSSRRFRLGCEKLPAWSFGGLN